MSDPVRTHRAKGRAELPSPRAAFLVSTLSAAVGRNGYYIVSAWILVERGYGSAGVATVLAIVSIVELIASPLVGVATDRFDRQQLNVAADLCRLLVALATAGALLYVDPFLTLCLSAAFFSFYDRVALTASQAMIPALARGRDLVTLNSIVFFVMQSGSLGAALLAGPLLQEHSLALPFTVLAASFLVSASCLTLVRLKLVSGAVRVAKISAIPIDLGLLRLVAVYALFYAGAVLVSVMGSSFVFQEQKGTSVDFGYLEAAWSVGSLIGAASLIRIERTMSAHALLLILLGLSALVLMALTSLRPPLTVILFAALGFLYNLGRVSVEVTLQSRVSDYLLGRAKGAMHTAAVALGSVVFGIVAIVGDRALPSMMFFSFGAVLLISISALTVGVLRSDEKGES